LAEEALALHRSLAAARPEIFISELARSLNNLGFVLSTLGRSEEALAALQEATDIRRKLALERPGVSAPNLALSLNNLASLLSVLGHYAEALAAAREALTILLPYFTKLPEAYASWIRVMVRQYTELSEMTGAEPDSALLEPIENALASSKARADAEPAANNS
jgi:tetratricopeptide (TPR) repeat protein